jgi:hypothetical protein
MNPFIQKLIGMAIGLLSSICLFLIYRFPTWWFFLVVILIWLVILVLVDLQVMKRLRYERINSLALHIFMMFSFVALLSLVEWGILRAFLIVLSGVVLALSFSGSVQSEIGYSQKPFRRMIMMLWVFCAYAFTTTFFAMGVLFPNFPFWILTIGSGVILGFISFMVWRLYSVKKEKLILWSVITAIIMMELVWVFHLLTLAHLSAGFFVAWIWYLISLFMRFNFDKKGIIWKNQKWFLLINAILFVVLLIFVVRWV